MATESESAARGHQEAVAFFAGSVHDIQHNYTLPVDEQHVADAAVESTSFIVNHLLLLLVAAGDQ